MSRKYYAYGTYAENGVLYTAYGEKITNPEKYYEACRKKYAKSHSGGSSSSTSKKTYTKKKSRYSGGYSGKSYSSSYDNGYSSSYYSERENASRAYHEYGIEGCEYMDDETFDMVEEGYWTDEDF